MKPNILHRVQFFLRKEYDGDGPFVPVRWGQYYPFNEDLPSNDIDIWNTPCSDSPNGYPPAGCVATAILQIMAGNSYPFQFQSGNGWYTCYWDTWRTYMYGWNFVKDSYDYKAISALVREIGMAVEMNYSCSGSTSTIKKLMMHSEINLVMLLMEYIVITLIG